MPTFEISARSPADVSADLLVLPVFAGVEPGPGVEALQHGLGGDVVGTLKAHRFSGKLGETFTLPTLGRIRAGAALLVGMGPRAEAGPGAVRKAAMKAGRIAIRFGTVASTLPAVGEAPDASGHAFAEGTVLGSYRFDRYKERPIDDASKEAPRLKRVIVLAESTAALRGALRRGQVYAEAGNWARDLVNTPALDATPTFLAEQARTMAHANGLTCRIWTKTQLQRGGFGGILGVGSGSENEPRLIELGYRGGGTATPIALTGKGITFDSGGLSLKDPPNMEWMKADMGGAAATMAAMRALAELQPNANVIAAIPSSENMPGGSAIRPGDVLRHRGGKTTEVLNTDAEGRLILADALAYLAEKKPQLIVDCATLTGAAMVALGQEVWGVMGTNDALVADLLAAGTEEGEPGWQLPLWTDYRRHLESSVADVKNVGIRWGGAITAGLFLREFVGDVPWAHLDVAGTAFVEGSSEYWPKGATGSPARTLIRFVESRAAGSRAAGRRGRQ